MKKFLFSMCSAAALALFACGGDNIDNLPLLGSTDNGSDGYSTGGNTGSNTGSKNIYGSCYNIYGECYWDNVSEYDCYEMGGSFNYKYKESCSDYGYEPEPGYSSSSSKPYSSSSSSNPSEGSYTVNNISNYKTVAINGQIWMAENLNYYVAGSKCYNNEASYCNKYGRLYDWATAMNISSYYNDNYYYSSSSSSNHQGICPSGWHLPSDAEWSTLTNYIESTYGSSTAGKHLKATSGWYSCSPSGSSYYCYDTYGFAALPGGYGDFYGNFGSAGNYGYWWSSSEGGSNEGGSNYAYYRYMFGYEYVYRINFNKSSFYSIRCLQD